MAYARFESSRIRDFIPLFVEKRARHDLGQRSSAVPV
ncbi:MULTISPECIES: three-helix bundle dimerization domain-containing protein [Mycobacterium]